MKYFVLFMTIFMCLILSACSRELENEFFDNNREIEADDIEADDILEVTSENDSSEEEASFSYLTWDSKNDNGIVLIDLMTSEEINALTLDEGTLILNILNSTNGYHAILVGILDEDDTWDFFSNEGIQFAYWVLDNELNVIEELFITNESLLSNWFTLFSSSDTVFLDDQLVIYYVENRRGIFSSNWTDENQYLRSYNIHTGATGIIFEIEDVDLVLEEIRKIDSDMFFFVGSRMSSQTGVHFGFIDLAAENLIIYNENFNRGELNFSGDHIIFAEGLDSTGIIPGQPNTTMEVERGEVIILNINTQNQYHIQLPGVESIWATLSLDGRYIVTIDDTFTFLKKYDIETGVLISEQEVNIEGETFLGIMVLPNDGYYKLLSHDLIADTVIDDITHQEIMEYREIVRIDGELE